MTYQQSIVVSTAKPSKRLVARSKLKKRGIGRVKRRKANKRPKVKSISKYIKEADAAMSIFVRTEEADNDGICTCYTCGYRAPIKKMQNGHLVSRYYKATRWDRRNCRVQCITCNMWRNGMTPHFAAKLKQELGEGIVDELYEKARQITKLTPNFVQGIIDLYKKKLTDLLANL